MPGVTLEFDEDGNLHTDYVGFAGKTCNHAEFRLLQILKGLKINKKSIRHKDDKMKEKVKA